MTQENQESASQESNELVIDDVYQTVDFVTYTEGEKNNE